MGNESTSSLQVYIQQWFHHEQGAKFMWSLTLSAWSKVTLDMYLSDGGYEF